MSSATLTKQVRLKADTTSDGVAADRSGGVAGGRSDGVAGGRSDGVARDRSVRLQPDRVQPDQGLQPWQFFVLAALGCATAVTFLARGQGVTTVILLGVLMASTVLVGIAMLRTLRPLVSADEDRTAMIGQRTRAALEREKYLTLRAIKELEFDRAMGKLAESDFQEMSSRLRGRAAGLIRQLDAGSSYRDQIERDLAKRLGDSNAKASAERHCASCSTVNEQDARFCKACGRALTA